MLRRRRTIPSAVPEQREPYSFGKFRLDFQSRTLQQDDKPLTLSGSEFALLKIFVNNPMRTLTRERLLELLHGPEYDGTDRGIDVQVWRLRRILETDPSAPPSVWVHGATDAGWIVVPVQPLRSPRSRDRMLMWLALIFLTAVLAALFGAWQLQHPLRSLAQAMQRFGRGQPTPPVPERGPRELRQLTHGFNTMVREVSQTENDRAVMLAGVAHDLKTPLARLRLRAEMMDDEKMRDGVMRDVDSMAHIVDQFLVFAHDRPDGSEPVPVDEQCERIPRAYKAVSPGAEPIRLKLEAGPSFAQPAATLERLLSNLLDNAHAYGAPPVVVETRRAAKGWVLAVSDHGKSIAPDDLIKASRPFVRLDPARGGIGHSGLGLAIVERLARRAGGECEIGNRVDGGLQVAMTFPFDLATLSATERRSGPQHEERAV